MRNTKLKSGFSLIEVLIALLLVGLAVASLVAANSAFTQANGAGTDLSTAEFLAEQIRELTALLPVIDPGSTVWTIFGHEAGETLATYNDLDDFNGTSFSPPINANRIVLNNFAAYRQQVTVQNVSASNFEQVVPPTTSSFVRVTVRVYMNSKEICSTSWLRALY
jgi:prepilin-type N-terminal cleavage/methylation domain-containing protein